MEIGGKLSHTVLSKFMSNHDRLDYYYFQEYGFCVLSK